MLKIRCPLEKEKSMKKTRLNNTILIAIALTAVMMISNSATAFDGQRKGFFFSLGLGPGYTSYSQTTDSAGAELYSLDESKFAVATNFSIGFAPSNKLMIYWMNKMAWFSVLDSVVSSDNATYAVSVGGLGITYFFKPQAPSLYVSFGGGLAARSLPFKGSDAWIGFGLAGGIGYEITDNWSFELDVLYGSPSDEYPEIGEEYSADAFAVGVTINVTAY
jgi:hypothetical protein